MNQRRSASMWAALIFGYAFLYVPLIIMMIFSFNESKLVTVWSRFSTKWYYELWHNDAMMRAAWVSFRIAATTATVAVFLGTIAAVVMVRLRPFRGMALFNGMITAPLVMPDVITGLALLLMFVGMESLIGWPQGRGILTITLAHITLAMSYVTVIVRARLLDLDYSIEEAALDLGAPPNKVFFLITLPIIAPTLAAGWLLAFALSLDDVVLASFLTGPNGNTLPIMILSSVRHGLSPQINALSTVIVGVLSGGVCITAFIIHRRAQASFQKS